METRNVVEESIKNNKKIKPTNGKYRILECYNSIRDIARKGFLTVALAAFTLANLPYSANAQERERIREVSPTTKQVNEFQYKEDVPKFISTLYGEAGRFGGIFEENPALLNTLIGYNILNKEPEDGVLLFPTARILVRGNRPDYPWDNYVDFGLGVAYQKSPFIFGLEGVFREPFESEGSQEDFLRLWGGYWDLWQEKTKKDSIKPLSEFQNGLWSTRYAGVDYNTFEKNAAADFRIDINRDLIDLGGLIIGPFAAGKINMDVKNQPWYRYGQVSVGIRARKGIFSVLFETGYRDSFNDKGLEGSFNAVYFACWFPLF